MHQLQSSMTLFAKVSMLTLCKEVELPHDVHVYHSLTPLDNLQLPPHSTSFGYDTWVYKALSRKDGKLYALRRISGGFSTVCNLSNYK